MSFAAVLFALLGLPLFLVACAFIFQRYCRKWGGRSGKKRRGFYPTIYALGLAFQQIQLFVAPSTAYTIEEKLKEEAEADDKGGPEGPAKHLERQLRRIRRGEKINRLATILRDKD